MHAQRPGKPTSLKTLGVFVGGSHPRVVVFFGVAFFELMAVLYRWLFEFDFMSLDFTDIYKVERFDPFDSERVPLFFS